MFGVDVGGTFTDVVVVRDGHVHVTKVPSFPEDPQRSVVEGARRLGVAGSAIFNHASTKGLNAILTRKLPKIEGERTVEARVEEASFFNVGTNGTGRHRVVSENGDTFVLPTPPAGVPMELKYGKRESKPPAVVKWLGKALGKAVEGTAGKMVAATLGAAVAGIGGAYFHAAVTPTETRIVQIPATTPLPSAHVESPPAAATAFVASPVLDAGAPRRR